MHRNGETNAQAVIRNPISTTVTVLVHPQDTIDKVLTERVKLPS